MGLVIKSLCVCVCEGASHERVYQVRFKEKTIFDWGSRHFCSYDKYTTIRVDYLFQKLSFSLNGIEKMVLMFFSLRQQQNQHKRRLYMK